MTATELAGLIRGREVSARGWSPWRSCGSSVGLSAV